MDLKELEALLSLSATPGFVLILGIYCYFQFKELRKGHASLKEGLDAIHNNGFVRKDILEEKEKRVEETHHEFDRRISLLEGKH